MKIIEDNKAISSMVGLILVLGIESMVIAAAIFGVADILDQKTEKLAEIQGQAIANSIANAIVDSITVSEQYPDLIYCQTIDIPRKIGGRDYFIEIVSPTEGETMVSVKTRDGASSAESTVYKTESITVVITGLINNPNDFVEVTYTPIPPTIRVT